MQKSLILLTLIASQIVSANCSKYYFSLDFGGRIGDGLEISEYLVKEKVPHVIFMVGYNLKTSEAKRLCDKINNDPEYKKYIKVGNHTQSHKGFIPSHTQSYIESEIMGNESLIKSVCTEKNYTKVFRYPKGQSHPLAEKILVENNYTGQFSQYSDKRYRTKTGVGWTADTRDWVQEGAASIWAQKTYALKHGKFMPVTEASKKELFAYIKKEEKSDSPLYKMMEDGSPEKFNSGIHKEIPGWHGPSQKFIEDKILNDKGIDGACVPLTHFGGFNTLGALKNVIPKLKEQGKSFEMLDDNINLNNVISILNNPEALVLDIEGKCQDPITNRNYVIVKNEDTLWGISQRTGIAVEDLKSYNNFTTNEINLGQKLYLEPLVDYHIVRSGETLYGLSQMYDVSIIKIKQLNSLGSNELEIGQKLIIKN